VPSRRKAAATVALGPPGSVGVALDVDEAVVGQLPHRLGVVGVERRLGPEQPPVPVERRVVVPDADPGEEVQLRLHAERA